MEWNEKMENKLYRIALLNIYIYMYINVFICMHTFDVIEKVRKHRVEKLLKHKMPSRKRYVLSISYDDV